MTNWDQQQVGLGCLKICNGSMKSSISCAATRLGLSPGRARRQRAAGAVAGFVQPGKVPRGPHRTGFARFHPGRTGRRGGDANSIHSNLAHQPRRPGLAPVPAADPKRFVPVQHPRGLTWMLATEGHTQPRTPNIAHDTTLRGWPWAEGTHAWIEPTAMHLIASMPWGRRRILVRWRPHSCCWIGSCLRVVATMATRLFSTRDCCRTSSRRD